MFKTYNKCTKAVIIYHQHYLSLIKSQINNCLEEKLYIPRKEVVKLENDYKRIEFPNVILLKSFLFSNMATVVWDQLVQNPVGDEELKVALYSFELPYNRINNFQDQIIKLTFEEYFISFIEYNSFVNNK